MRFDSVFYLCTLLTAVAAAGIEPRHVVRIEAESASSEQDLYKRRGGGGGGGRGGGGGGGGRGGSSGGSRGGSSGGSRGGSGGSGGGGSSSRPSNAGGASRSGSGPQPNYGGGRFYGGGARTPYTSGGRSPSNIAPFALLGVGALAFWPGYWYGSAHIYRYGREGSDNNTYEYYNITTDKDEERTILCACAVDEVCGCDPNDDVMKELVGNGSYAALNKTIINVGRENKTDFFLINGTLPDGTTLRDPEAAEQNDDDDDEGAANSLRGLVEALGFWPAAAAVGCAVLLT
ncbi:conserved glycine-rich protein [Sarocladium implicatum]|nr:conserved glycine-rich protein [Sarocladium implicatum]